MSLLFFSALEYVQTNIAYPRSKGDLSILESQHVVGTAKCLRFSYKISGDEVGRLNVYIVSQDDSASLLWRISGSEGNEWKTAQVPIDVALGFKVTWRLVEILLIIGGECGAATLPPPRLSEESRGPHG